MLQLEADLRSCFSARLQDVLPRWQPYFAMKSCFFTSPALKTVRALHHWGPSASIMVWHLLPSIQVVSVTLRGSSDTFRLKNVKVFTFYFLKPLMYCSLWFLILQSVCSLLCHVKLINSGMMTYMLLYEREAESKQSDKCSGVPTSSVRFHVFTSNSDLRLLLLNYSKDLKCILLSQSLSAADLCSCCFYSALQKYSPPLNFATFCHILTTNVHVFYWDFMWYTSTKWYLIVKWKEIDRWL